jgi:hypothetical protein
MYKCIYVYISIGEEEIGQIEGDNEGLDIYEYVYVYTYIYTYIHTYIHMKINKLIFINVYIYMYIGEVEIGQIEGDNEGLDGIGPRGVVHTYIYINIYLYTYICIYIRHIYIVINIFYLGDEEIGQIEGEGLDGVGSGGGREVEDYWMKAGERDKKRYICIDMHILMCGNAYTNTCKYVYIHTNLHTYPYMFI